MSRSRNFVTQKRAAPRGNGLIFYRTPANLSFIVSLSFNRQLSVLNSQIFSEILKMSYRYTEGSKILIRSSVFFYADLELPHTNRYI
jgi:hypothetical protein